MVEPPLSLILSRALKALMAMVMALAAVTPALAVSVARDTEIEEYLWEESKDVFVAAGLDPNAVTIYLVNDPSINAFVAGGQNMFIFTGLIDALDRPNQLLGVIAHETGHISGGHLSRAGGAISNEVAPFLITMLAGLAAMLAGEGQAGMGIIMGAQHAMQRAVLGYSRVQESSADQAAITYLNKIKKSGRGMLETFELFAQQELLSARMQDPFARSHPMSRERLASLEDRVNSSPYVDVPDDADLVRRYALIRAKVHGFMDRPDVTLRRYPAADLSDPARYARAVAYYRQPNFVSANYEIDSLLKTNPGNPYFWELKGQILAEQRDFRGAAAAFEKSVSLKPRAPLLEVNLGASLVALGDAKSLSRARDVLESSLRGDPTNAFAWLQLSVAYSELKNEGMAALAMAEQRFNMARYGDAIRFAARAKKMLPAGSREANRADDIIVIATAQNPDDEEDDNRRRFSITAPLTERE
jgi:predicted Zn-dependent protease